MKRQSIGIMALVCAVIGSATAQQLDTIIYLPDTLGGLLYPRQILANPLTGRVYVVNEEGNVVVFDPETRTKTRIFRGAHLSAVFCPEVEKIYLGGPNDGTIRVVDAGADTLLALLQFEVEVTSPLALSRTSGKLYFSLEDTGLCVLDVRSDSVLAVLVAAAYQNSVVWDSARDWVFAGSELEYMLVIDCAQDTVIAEIEMPEELYWLALASDRRKVYAAGHDAIYSVDADSFWVIDSIPLRRYSEDTDFRPMGYNPGTGRLYAAGVLEPDTGIAVIDCDLDTLRAFIVLPGPAGLAVNAVRGLTYVGCLRDGVAILDRGDSIAGRLFAGAERSFTALGTYAERGEMYCAMQTDSLAIVDIASDSVKGFVNYESYTVREMLFNPAGRKLYLLCPGQDVVLVVGPDYRVAGRIPLPGLRNNAAWCLNPGLNRLYISDVTRFRVIDCNRDIEVSSHTLAGFKQGIPLLVPGLNRLYLFPANALTSARVCWVYDCLADSFTRAINIGERTPCAVFHPRTNRFYFGCRRPPVVRILDPIAESIVGTIDAGRDLEDGRMLADTDRDRIYFTNDVNDSMYVIDPRAGSGAWPVARLVNVDGMFWNREWNRLYMTRYSPDAGALYVYDCASGVVDSLAPQPFAFAGVMNERSDRLFIGTTQGIAVIDCRTDSITALLPEAASPWSGALNPIDNKVYLAQRASWVAVFQDDPASVGERAGTALNPYISVVGNPCRERAVFLCRLPAGEAARLSILDVAGRRVAAFGLGGRETVTRVVWNRTDSRGRRVPTGVYFGRLERRGSAETVKVVME